VSPLEGSDPDNGELGSGGARCSEGTLGAASRKVDAQLREALALASGNRNTELSVVTTQA
jgi:hypothetical protein